MGNMSYCRFRNTVSDLQDCVGHICDDDLSEDEIKARKALVRCCRRIVEEADEQDEFNGEPKEN
jgi:hypothetical protein